MALQALEPDAGKRDGGATSRRVLEQGAEGGCDGGGGGHGRRSEKDRSAEGAQVQWRWQRQCSLSAADKYLKVSSSYPLSDGPLGRAAHESVGLKREFMGPSRTAAGLVGI